MRTAGKIAENMKKKATLCKKVGHTRSYLRRQNNRVVIAQIVILYGRVFNLNKNKCHQKICVTLASVFLSPNDSVTPILINEFLLILIIFFYFHHYILSFKYLLVLLKYFSLNFINNQSVENLPPRMMTASLFTGL